MLLPCPYCDFRLDVDLDDDRETIRCRRCKSTIHVEKLLRKWRRDTGNRNLNHAIIAAAILLALYLLWHFGRAVLANW